MGRQRKKRKLKPRSGSLKNKIVKGEEPPEVVKDLQDSLFDLLSLDIGKIDGKTIQENLKKNDLTSEEVDVALKLFSLSNSSDDNKKEKLQHCLEEILPKEKVETSMEEEESADKIKEMMAVWKSCYTKIPKAE